jgi:hypothetical protein
VFRLIGKPRPDSQAVLPEAHGSLISPEDRCGSAIDRAIHNG